MKNISKLVGKVRNKRNKLFVKQMSVQAMRDALKNARGTQKSKLVNELAIRG